MKTVSDYQQEKAGLTNQMENVNQAFHQQSQKLTDDSDKLKRKYQPKIKELKEETVHNQYLLEQHKCKLEEAQVNLNDFTVKARIEKEKALQNLEIEIGKASDELLRAQQQIKDSIQKLLKAENQERDNKIAAEQENVNAAFVKIEIALKEKKREYQEQKNTIEQHQRNELHTKGADTKRLAEINSALTTLEKELTFINANRDIVVLYNRDKTELLDKVSEFKKDKNSLEQHLETEEQTYRSQKEIVSKDIQLLAATSKKLHGELKNITEDLEKYAGFKLTEAYQNILHLPPETNEEYKTDKRGLKIIEELSAKYYAAIKRVDALKEAINKFLSNFSPQNIFSFKTSLIDTLGNFDFAGINIYLSEYKKHILEKSQFYLPENLENFIKLYGNKGRYNLQKLNFDNNTTTETQLIKMVTLLHKYKKGLDQEILISSNVL